MGAEPYRKENNEGSVAPRRRQRLALSWASQRPRRKWMRARPRSGYLKGVIWGRCLFADHPNFCFPQDIRDSNGTFNVINFLPQRQLAVCPTKR
jgi:hypothetical protein